MQCDEHAPRTWLRLPLEREHSATGVIVSKRLWQHRHVAQYSRVKIGCQRTPAAVIAVLTCVLLLPVLCAMPCLEFVHQAPTTWRPCACRCTPTAACAACTSATGCTQRRSCHQRWVVRHGHMGLGMAFCQLQAGQSVKCLSCSLVPWLQSMHS